jgi:hypothetical protein
MAPVYKFALIQMQPKVSRPFALCFKTGFPSLVFISRTRLIKAPPTLDTGKSWSSQVKRKPLRAEYFILYGLGVVSFLCTVHSTFPAL